jgi:long-chain acyl-CoA synthetase
VNAADYLLNSAGGMRPQDPALITLAQVYSYAQIRQGMEAVAGFLLRAGLRKGDRAALIGENSYFWVCGYLGILRAGGVAVPLPAAIASTDLEYILTSAGIRMALAGAKIAAPQQAVLQRLDCLLRDNSEWPGATPAPPHAYPPIEPEKDLAALMFTSGSTGRPHGVMVSHRNIVANTASILSYLCLTRSDRIMTVLPFYYCYGTSLLHTHLRAGASLVLDARFMFPDKILRRMQATECTGFAGVPSHFQILLRQSSLAKMSFPALRYVQQAGGKLARNMIQQMRQALPQARFFVMYGQTEATARLSYLPPELLDAKLGSIGKGIPGVQLRVLDECGEAVAPGETGELVAVGENVAMGYWGDDAETASVFRNGRLYTGDLATVDADGFIYIVDRSKDILKCGGNRVACKDVEDALLEFEDLVEAAVVGVPDELLGEAVKAFVVARNGAAGCIPRLQDFCVRRLPPNLVPKEIVRLERLPKNESGKVQKRALKAEASDGGRD